MKNVLQWARNNIRDILLVAGSIAIITIYCLWFLKYTEHADRVTLTIVVFIVELVWMTILRAVSEKTMTFFFLITYNTAVLALAVIAVIFSYNYLLNPVHCAVFFILFALMIALFGIVIMFLPRNK